MTWPETDQFYIVDVFSELPYQGNPLAVVFGDYPAETMQAITREMNYSETTFVGPQRPDGRFPVRIFTPGRELPFAGHPTLGTAFVLREIVGVTATPLVLQEGVGPIPVQVESGDVYWMRQNSAELGRCYRAEEMAPLLGLTADEVDPRHPIQVVSTGLPALIVPLRSLEAAARARLAMDAYRPYLEQGAPSSVLVFALGAAQALHDLHVRVFVGDLGIPEDPATGSANGSLAGYLAHYRVVGKTVDVVVEQGLEMGRPSTLYLRAEAGGHAIQVQVGGRVVAVAEGRLRSTQRA